MARAAVTLFASAVVISAIVVAGVALSPHIGPDVQPPVASVAQMTPPPVDIQPFDTTP